VGGWLLVNPRSGADSAVDELPEAAAARGVEVRVLRPGGDAAALAHGAEADVLGGAGATAPWRRSQPRPSIEGCLSSRSRSARATTSPATSASTAPIPSRPSTPSKAS